MNMKLNSLRFAIVTAAVSVGLSAGNVQAQSATGTLSGVLVGSTYDYTLTVNNTGTVPLEGLWYGWIPGVFDLPGTLSSIGSTSGWTGTQDGASIQFQGGSGNAIPVGGTGTFTFDSTATPAQMTTSPADESTIFAGTIGFSGNSPGVSEEFTPTLASVPEPSTVGLIVTGAMGVFVAGRRKFGRWAKQT